MRRRQAHIFDKEARGHYVEPAWISRRLFEVENFGTQAIIYDPACGWGTITNEARARGFEVYGSDIVNRRRHKLGKRFFRTDFLTVDQCPPNASIITNPPFDLVEEFARHAIEIGPRKVAMVCLVRRLNAARWLQELPLRRIWLLTPRPSMPPGSWIAKGNKPGGGTQDFCWLVFERGYLGTPGVGWLHRDGEKANERKRA